MNPNINGFSNFPGGNMGGQEISCTERIKTIWASVPLFVRFIIISTLTFYFANLAWYMISLSLANIPYYTLFYFQIWRFITTVLITTGIFNILFAFLAWIPDAMRLEQQTGTIRYMLNFFINSTLIQIIYSLILLALYPFLGKGVLLMNVSPDGSTLNNGLWPLIMAEITLLCQVNPENPVMLFFIPIQFRAKFYPFVLLAFFTLLNGIQFDLLAGVCYGYLFFYFLRHKIQFTDSFITKCEGFFLFRCLASLTGFVTQQSVGNMVGYSVTGPAPQINESTRPGQTSEIQAFSGKGVTVGSSTRQDEQI